MENHFLQYVYSEMLLSSTASKPQEGFLFWNPVGAVVGDGEKESERRDFYFKSPLEPLHSM